MNRRMLIKKLIQDLTYCASAFSVCSCSSFRIGERSDAKASKLSTIVKSSENTNKYQHEIKTPTGVSDQQLKKNKNFDHDFHDDIFLPPADRPILDSVLRKMLRVQNYVGFGYFNIISFEEILQHTRNQSRLETFSQVELEFIYKMFAEDAGKLGFFGTKTCPSLDMKIDKNDLEKIPESGHYLIKGDPLKIYNRLKNDLGPSIILTSGVRNIGKQLILFLNKISLVNYNLSRASRSLAPAGYSYHAVGDFDIGKRGLGSLNFTSRFSETDEFKKLVELGYVDIRYPADNPFGVRFEPWHIEVEKHS